MNGTQIRKTALLKFPRNQVWQALTNSQEFGLWFGMKLQGPFVDGQKIQGSITPTTVDPEIAKMQKPFEGTAVELWVHQLEAEHLFSFYWHPFAVDPKEDYSQAPKTLITFTLQDQGASGILLTVTESGFEKIPEPRRSEAMKSNEGGWEAQMGLIKKYLEMK